MANLFNSISSKFIIKILNPLRLTDFPPNYSIIISADLMHVMYTSVAYFLP